MPGLCFMDVHRRAPKKAPGPLGKDIGKYIFVPGLCPSGLVPSSLRGAAAKFLPRASVAGPKTPRKNYD